MSPFQMIVTGVFVVLLIVGVGTFALFGGLIGSSGAGPVAIWGTLPANTMGTIIDSLKSVNKDLQDVTYVEKDPATYQSDLINAIAAGGGPDLALISEEDLGTLSDKLLVIPYSAISQSTFVNSFIDESQIFLVQQGAIAAPFSIDPMVMYWNRDLLASAGVGQPPQYWNDFLTIAPRITSLDASQNVRQSAVALGEWQNVDHAKQILSTLFMQAGDPIVARDPQSGVRVSVLGSTPSQAAENPAESALRFYTEFANPSKTTYSWNRSLKSSGQAFAAGEVGMYFGFASESKSIAARNPNLRFAIALMPQLKGSTNHITYGTLSGLAIPRSSHNPQGAQRVAVALSSQAAASVVVRETGLPSVRRDLAVDTSASSAANTLAQSALISAAWYDPNAAQTDRLFKVMIESVVSGKLDPTSAVAEAAQELSAFFQTH